MKCYYECFNKHILLNIYKPVSAMLDFWLERFCPGIKKIDNECLYGDDCDLHLEFIEANKYDYEIANNVLKIYGEITENTSYIAKFITQCFQKLLVEDDVLIIPAACVTKNGKALLIIGDFWQGKTSVAINLSKENDVELISDNYIAIKDCNVIGTTKYLSIRKEDLLETSNSLHCVNDRYFCECSAHHVECKYNVVGFLLPHINNGDNNVHVISKEESTWYLYQKFTRLLCGESILFDGKFPSPIFLNKHNSQKILDIVNNMLINNQINYVSSSIDKIVAVGKTILK